jgi:(p)ppGpp synthase/HD superfamily hydrolase
MIRDLIEAALVESVSVATTLDFIKVAHAGQKYGNKPYWTHPVDVAVVGKELFGGTFDVVCHNAALLHDVLEDTLYTEDDLRKRGYKDDVLEVVKLVTKERTLDYEGNIKRIIASGNRRAMMVKYSDNFVNYNGDKSGWTIAKRESAQTKYKKSMIVLAKALGKPDLPIHK